MLGGLSLATASWGRSPAVEGGLLVPGASLVDSAGSGRAGSAVSARLLSCPLARGIGTGIGLLSSALAGGFLITGPPGKSLRWQDLPEAKTLRLPGAMSLGHKAKART